MAWEVEYTEAFEVWWDALTVAEQIDVDAAVRLLESKGPTLGYPQSSSIHRSKHGHMRELRIQHQGRPYRVLYAFDPRRIALVLLGGEKTGDDQWYEHIVPLADRLYDAHLQTLRHEGFSHG